MEYKSIINDIKCYLESCDADSAIEAMNEIKIAMHESGPFKNEPVDCVLVGKKLER